MLELESREVVASFTRSKDAITVLASRLDGKLLAVGNESGIIFILETKKLSLIRTIQAHNKPLTALQFLGSSSILISASENGQLKMWDVSTGLLHSDLDSTTDYTSSIWSFEGNDCAFVTAGYDHKIRFWNATQFSVTDTMSFDSPIEDIAIHVDLDLLIVACKADITFWRLSEPSTAPIKITPHQKAITRICLSRCKNFLCAVSLDKHASLIRLSDFSVVGHVSIKSGGLCVTSLTNDEFVIGTKSGRTVRINPIAGLESSIYVEPRLSVQFSHFNRVRKSAASRLLRKFEFSQFLNLFTEEGKSSLEFIAAIGTLIHFNGLRSAITARSSQELANILDRTRRALNQPIYHDWCQEVISAIVELYDQSLLEADAIDSLKKCCMRIKSQASYNDELVKVIAMADS